MIHRLTSAALAVVPFFAMLPAQVIAPNPAAQPINAIIADTSFAQAFGDAGAAARSDETLRITTHLRFVEQMLRERDVRDWPADLQLARRENIERLHTYREHGVFPRNFDHQHERRPCFLDRDGRLCAVGHLIAESAGRELAEHINARFQYTLLEDMRDARLTGWARRSGPTLRELATIQPAYAPQGASVQGYGQSCAPVVTTAPVAVPDPVQHYGMYGGFILQPPPAWWLPAPAGAQWIGSVNYLNPAMSYELTLTFDLTGFDPSTATIGGDWLGNSGMEIVVNGVPSGVTVPASGWTGPAPFVLGSGFVAGINVLAFRVPQGEGLFGLLVHNLAGTGQHLTSPGTALVPIPGLFDTGMDAAGAPLAAGGSELHYRSNEPPLRTISRPISPNPGFGFTLASQPNRLALLALSFYSANTALGSGCSAYIDTTSMVTFLGMTDSAGVAVFPTPMPPILFSFGGPFFYAQGVVEDATSSLSGLSTTQGLALHVGI